MGLFHADAISRVSSSADFAHLMNGLSPWGHQKELPSILLRRSVPLLALRFSLTFRNSVSSPTSAPSVLPMPFLLWLCCFPFSPLCLCLCRPKMTAVRFEPTELALVELEPTPLGQTLLQEPLLLCFIPPRISRTVPVASPSFSCKQVLQCGHTGD